MTATSTTLGARDHARAQGGTVAEAMPIVPAAGYDGEPPDGVDRAALTWAETVAGGGYTSKVLARGTTLRLLGGTSNRARNDERYGDTGSGPATSRPASRSSRPSAWRADGTLRVNGSPAPFGAVTIRAELPLIVLVANVPHPLDPREEYVCSPLQILAWHGEPTRPDDPLWTSLRAGQHLTIVDLEGNQAVDRLLYNAADTADRYSAPDTIAAQGGLFLTTGSVLRSCEGTALMTVVADDVGRHDTVGGAWSKECNWYMNVPVEEDGTLGIVDGISAAGLSLTLRAEIDTLVLISNCPQVNNPCNGFDPTPIRVVVGPPA